MKKVFISHPFADDPHVNKLLVDKICRDIILSDMDILPISPLHLFGFVDEETPKLREEILDTCYKLIDVCDEVWLYVYDMHRSCGQAKENNYALEKGKNVVYINADRLEVNMSGYQDKIKKTIAEEYSQLNEVQVKKIIEEAEKKVKEGNNE